MTMPLTELRRPFDVTAPIPHGTTLIEASAGTGKTWTLAALVTRLVAEEGLPLEKLLVVTFSRAASQELRERVRSHMADTLHALRRDAREDDDTLIRHLRSADSVDVLCDRLAQALATFDRATIATIHQFCHLVLKGLGVAGDSDSFATLVDDVDGLRRQGLDDEYVRSVRDENGFALTYEKAQSIAKAVLDNAGASFSPDPAPAQLQEAMQFAQRIRAEYGRRKRRAAVLEYDDLLLDLRAALKQPNSVARDRMRAQWDVVLVDEFQDTDPVQWDVFRTAFGDGGRALILVGDPKQAIYGFRGGDVQTYLTAATTASQALTLPTNYRSDAPLVDALQVLMGGVELSPDIVAHPVTAGCTGSSLTGPDGTPVELRWVPLPEPAPIDDVRRVVYADVAVRAAKLLTSGLAYKGKPIAPQDLAVLTFTRKDLVAIREALRAVGIPAVMMAGDSVLRSSAGQWWLELLLGLEQPHRAERVRAACLTPLLGWTAEEIAALETAEVDRAAEQIHTLRALFEDGGIAAVADTLRSGGMLVRLLECVGGERDVTDIEHCAQLLAERQLTTGAGISSLVAWVQDQITQDAKVAPEARLMRLDSDAQAVTLATIHSSKGLQYPVVFAPMLWNRRYVNPDPPAVVYSGGERRLSFSPEEVEAASSREERAGEEMRLAYVAMTRARSKVVLWWAPSARNTRTSALHRLLFGQARGAEALDHLLADRVKGQAGTITTFEQRGMPSEEDARAVFRTWAAHGAFDVVEIDGDSTPPKIGVPVSDTPLSLGRFNDRVIDQAWRRTSYSALAAAGERADEMRATAGMLGVVSEPDGGVRTDVDADLDLSGLTAARPETRTQGSDAPSPMADQPMGATFGSLVHAVLEEADFQAEDLQAELRLHIVQQQERWPAPVDIDTLVAALAAVLTTPFGPLAGDVSLRQIVARDRIAEMDFEIPLAGGDEPHQNATLRAFAQLLREYLDPDDPLRGYADHLDTSALGEETLRGYLTGSIDLTFRHGGRFYVVDYKTNRLGDPDMPLTLADYAPEQLTLAMNHSSYPLQAILYAVVLHRYLRWRLPGYNPETHLGGVMYLYVRGMAGADTPRGEDGTPFGVFTWQPPCDLVVALSEVIDGRYETRDHAAKGRSTQ